MQTINTRIPAIMFYSKKYLKHNPLVSSYLILSDYLVGGGGIEGGEISGLQVM